MTLWTDFSLWHYVLNYWYLPSSIAEPMEEKSIQGTLWEITLGQVRECRYFTAR